eukprot:3443179-Prymnesium_polylepis.1
MGGQRFHRAPQGGAPPDAAAGLLLRLEPKRSRSIGCYRRLPPGPSSVARLGVSQRQYSAQTIRRIANELHVDESLCRILLHSRTLAGP